MWPTTNKRRPDLLNFVADIASVIAPYQATGPEQLSLSPGQLISVRKKSPSGWWEGELQVMLPVYKNHFVTLDKMLLIEIIM